MIKNKFTILLQSYVLVIDDGNRKSTSKDINRKYYASYKMIIINIILLYYNVKRFNSELT